MAEVYECDCSSCQAMGRLMVIDAPCGCVQCNDEIQSGHFACRVPPAWLVEAEALGMVQRLYHTGEFVWVLIADDLDAPAPDGEPWRDALNLSHTAWQAWEIGARRWVQPYDEARVAAEFVRKHVSIRGPVRTGCLLRRLGWRVRTAGMWCTGAEYAPAEPDPIATAMEAGE